MAKRIYTDVEQLIGNTPLLELIRIEKKFELESNIYAKLEFFNPAGSIKDRAARKMIDDAEQRGLLNKGSVIIEPTSGNMGIGIALMGLLRGYRTIIVMPESMSEERRKLIKAYGAELVLTDKAKGMKGSIEKAEELKKEIPNAFIPGQFVNDANAMAHYETTGPEIWTDTDGEVDIFVSGIGTGGTITGTGRFLKEKNPNVKIIAVEPDTSAVLSGEKAGSHGIQGIGAGFIPKVLDTDIYDEVIRITDEEAFEAGRMLVNEEGVLVGISAGAAVCAAVKIAKRKENKGKRIVVILPDTGARYLSTAMFKE